jgi:hypothetical protein
MSDKCKGKNGTCWRTPSFNTKDKNKAEYCGDCRLPDMIDVKHGKCSYNDCFIQASYGKTDKSTPTHCAKHGKMYDLVQTKLQYCENPGCKLSASFGYENEKAKFCKEHSEEQIKKDSKNNVNKKMICVKTKSLKCVNINKNGIKCETRASFNYKGFKKGLYCKEHKSLNMINVVDKICEFTGGCETRANYNYPGEKKKFCAKHISKGMIDVTKYKCKEKGCDTIPTFGYKEDKKPSYCKDHIKDNMVDIRHTKCFDKNCDVRPIFGYADNPKILYCATHAAKDMIDIENRKCVKCNKRAYCPDHRDNNMYDYVKIKPHCSECIEDAYYAYYNNNYPDKCEKHATDKHFNIVEKPCNSCGLIYLLGKNSLCNNCDVFIKNREHTKEKNIKCYFDENNIKYESYDKTIDPSCNLKRPDFVIDFPLFKIIVEVDENQHKSYAKECEIIRMKQIHQSFGGTPVIFIRYNPDSFKLNGVEQNINTLSRMKILEKYINSYKNIDEWNLPLSCVYLFYDEYQNNKENKLIHIDY